MPSAWAAAFSKWHLYLSFLNKFYTSSSLEEHYWNVYFCIIIFGKRWQLHIASKWPWSMKKLMQLWMGWDFQRHWCERVLFDVSLNNIKLCRLIGSSCLKFNRSNQEKKVIQQWNWRETPESRTIDEFNKEKRPILEIRRFCTLNKLEK